ncbi:hypothetical protein RND81_11G007000 [Saponaria officinalis]|uniref:Uncharacterized protein n=1 Tax=Saponaria officinalis TaxID=3572 RepID=A0AAW1HGG8_SAPOF
MVSLNSFTFAVNLQSTQTLLKMFAYMLYRRRRTSKLNLLPRPFLMFGLSGCILTKKRTLHIPSPRRGTNTSQKKSRNRITVVECSNQQRPPRRRRTSKAKGNARGSRQAKTTVKKRRPEIKGSKHIDKSRLRRKRAKTAAEDNVTEQSEVRICGAAVGNGFCHQSERRWKSQSVRHISTMYWKTIYDQGQGGDEQIRQRKRIQRGEKNYTV